jgi:hypothetical protein
MKDNKTVTDNIVYSDIVCKNPDRVKADKSFWEKFPSNKLPYKPKTKINSAKLEEKIVESKAKLNNSSWNRA